MIKDAAKEAQIQTMTLDEILMSKYISACTDEPMKEKLMEMQDPTLEQVETLIEMMDSAKAGGSQMRSSTVNVEKVNKAWQQQGKRGKKSDGDNCASCNRSGHNRADCRMKDATCHWCQRKGHMQTACRDKKSGKPKQSADATRATKEESKEKTGLQETVTQGWSET